MVAVSGRSFTNSIVFGCLNLATLSFRYSRTPYYQRHFHAVLIKVLFSQQPMTAYCQAVIRSKNNYGILIKAILFKSIDNTPNTFIKMCNQPIIIGQYHFYKISRSGPGKKVFIAHCQVVERKWMQRHKIRRKTY